MARLEPRHIFILIAAALLLLIYFRGIDVSGSIKLAGETFTRTTPNTVSPNQQFSVTYTSTSSSTEYFVSWRDTITGGCTPNYYENFLSKTSADSPTQAKTITYTAPTSGSCTFTGNYKFAGLSEVNLPNKVITICASSPEVCDGIDNNCNGQIDDGLTQSQSCGSNIGYCQYGTQTKTCSSGTWGAFGTCTGGRNAITEICGNGVDEDCDGADLVGNTLADTNCDQCVAYSELISLADKWIQKTASYTDLVNSATQWIARDKTKC